MSKRRASSDQTSGSYAEQTRSPTPSSSPQLNGNGGRRSIDPAPRRTDPTALPIRVMKILEEFFVTHLPYPKKSDDDLPPGLMLDEKLPPVLFFLSRAAVGSEPMRVCLKDTLLPFNLRVYSYCA